MIPTLVIHSAAQRLCLIVSAVSMTMGYEYLWANGMREAGLDDVNN